MQKKQDSISSLEVALCCFFIQAFENLEVSHFESILDMQNYINILMEVNRAANIYLGQINIANFQFPGYCRIPVSLDQIEIFHGSSVKMQ
jgi:hypothetical protein